MKNPARSPFAAIFQAEVLLNTKRVAPYAMAILFASNALLWWGWGPAVGRGWATNSDSFIAGVLPVYSFLTLPLFTALIMADPVIRDFRIGIAPLIFTKPIGRAEYLLGKFFGNFLVLVCCQATFVLTLFALQAFRRPVMIVQEVQTFSYLKHFLIFVVLSHVMLAAFYFTIGTLSRNAKVVYCLGVSFYPLYIAYQALLLKSLPSRLGILFDPLLMNWGEKPSAGRSAEWLNQHAVTYDFNLIANRALMVMGAGACLAILYFRFAITDRRGKAEEIATLNLSTAAAVFYDSESFRETSPALLPGLNPGFARILKREAGNSVPLPATSQAATRILAPLIAVLGVEFGLLRTERSLVVILPLAILLSFLTLPFEIASSGGSYSAAFASSTANGLLLFLLGVIVFYTGEAMHRDRELRVEPVLWSMPVPSVVLLLSRFLTTISLVTGLIALVSLTAIVTQLLRGRTPVEISPYLATYAVILFPTIVFMTAASIALNVLLRNKYLAYAVCIAMVAGVFHLYNLGHNHWLYNPALYQLWTYSDLTGAGNGQGRILGHRIYCLALSCLWLGIAQLGFERKSPKGLMIDGRLGSKGWSLMVMCVSALVALVAGLVIK